MENKTKLGIGVFVVLALIGTVFYVSAGDTIYECKDLGIGGICFKLSTPNNGISTRCYYNESEPLKYKTCSSGWEIVKEQNITGEIIDISDSEDLTNVGIKNNTYEYYSNIAGKKNKSVDEYVSDMIEAKMVKDMQWELSLRCDELTVENNPDELQKRLNYLRAYK